MICGGARVSEAQDIPAQLHNADFRVRVSAALAIGRTKPPGARALLEQALGDTHPGVRAAAAAALGALGDPGAIPALERTSATETSGSAEAQMSRAVVVLRGPATPAPVARIRYVVRLGTIGNGGSDKDERTVSFVRAAAATSLAALPGALVIDGDEPTAMLQARARHVPAFLLEGQLNELERRTSGVVVSVRARVDFSVRALPGQTLRGTLRGTASGTVPAPSSEKSVSDLQNRAIERAIDGALRDADLGLTFAAR
jgi:HEAT repeats